MAATLKQAASFDILHCRADFPALQTRVHGRPVGYLDTAASAQKPRAVIGAMSNVMETYYANIHRGLYHFSQETTAAFEAARGKVARFIGAPAEREIIFTRNATEAINLVAQSWGRTFLRAGDEIILSAMEHHANLVPWQLLRDQIGVVLKIIPVLSDGTLDLKTYAELLSGRTKLIACVHVSNALGTINPVQKITTIAKNYNVDISVLVDGSQAVVHGPVDVAAIGCDFYIFTGHKLYGPTGVGVLWGRYALLEAMPPYQGGGDMVDTVTFEKTTFKAPPARFEAGTPAIVEVIGLGAAVDYLQAIGMDAVAAHEQKLSQYAHDKLQKIGGITMLGATAEKVGIFSFTAEWGGPADIGMILDQQGVAVRVGHHCCQPLLRHFNLDATVRASLGLYSNIDDVDTFISGLDKAKAMLS